MTVKVIVLSEEEYLKLPKDLNIMHEEEHDSLDDFQISSTIADIHINIDELDVSDMIKDLLRDEVYTLAMTLLDNYSFSSYNEYITNMLMEKVEELVSDENNE